MQASIEQLAILKEQLKRSLAQVEAQQRAVEQSMEPQTLAEIEQLEQKMVEALKALHAKKAQLQEAAEKPDQDEEQSEE